MLRLGSWKEKRSFDTGNNNKTTIEADAFGLRRNSFILTWFLFLVGILWHAVFPPVNLACQLRNARPITLMVDELERADKETALVTLCVGAGMGTATIIERV